MGSPIKWNDYFKLDNITVLPCPHRPNWKYHHFDIVATKPFDIFVNKRHKYSLEKLMVYYPVNVPISIGNCCKLIIQQLPITVPQIAPKQCFYGEGIPSIDYIVRWLRGLIRGDNNTSHMYTTAFEYMNVYVYMLRTFHALNGYLGDDLFMKFYNAVD
jgi:hypothetical protein